MLWGGTLAGGTDNRDVYEMDPLTWVITRRAGTGDTPDNPQTNGTFGRWAYLGDCGSNWRGLFVLVNNAAVEHGHFPAGKIDHFTAGGHVIIVERRAFGHVAARLSAPAGNVKE